MQSIAPNLVKSGDLHVISVSLTQLPETVISARLPSVNRTETSGDCLKRKPVSVIGVPPVRGPVKGSVPITAYLYPRSAEQSEASGMLCVGQLRNIQIGPVVSSSLRAGTGGPRRPQR